jgi:predicted MPP superfamily phosphohydrolase
MKTPAWKISRRRFLGGVSIAAAGTLGYARLFEAERLQVSHVTVPLAGGSRRPLKLLHLSDLHASGVVGLDYIESALDRALEWQPEVICLTGDFVTQRFPQAAEYARILRKLSAAAPCFATLGNHDGGTWSRQDGGYADVSWISRVLGESKITLLHNTALRCQAQDWSLQFVGVGDTWAENFDPDAAFRTAQSGNRTTGDTQTILLSHNPDTKDAMAAYPWNLLLSGHTHGGQLRVPWIGATPFAPVRDQRFVAGLHRWNERWIHVTKGVGSVFGMRINCPPEISCLTLT